MSFLVFWNCEKLARLTMPIAFNLTVIDTDKTEVVARMLVPELFCCSSHTIGLAPEHTFLGHIVLGVGIPDKV
jgi:hypothetical protein